jgi:hypothetical protein
MLPKIDETVLKVLFFLIPGIIALEIVKALGPKRPRTDFENGVSVFIYGIACYAIAGFLEGAYESIVVPAPPGSISVGFWARTFNRSLSLAILNPQNGLGAEQIAFATFIGIVLGFFVAYAQTHSLIHNIVYKLRLTLRTNEVDIWQFTLTSADIDSWVTVRHHENGKTYQGWIRAYSDGGDERELLLADVSVFAKPEDSNDLVLVDEIPVLYLGLDRKNAILELRSVSPQESGNGKQHPASSYHQ